MLWGMHLRGFLKMRFSSIKWDLLLKEGACSEARGHTEKGPFAPWGFMEQLGLLTLWKFNRECPLLGVQIGPGCHAEGCHPACVSFPHVLTSTGHSGLSNGCCWQTCDLHNGICISLLVNKHHPCGYFLPIDLLGDMSSNLLPIS